MDKIEVAKGVAEELWATERALDAAIAQAGDCVAAMIEARRELNLSAVVGAEAQTKIMEAIGALAQARSAVVAAHGDLAVVQRRVGVGPLAIGPTKPEEWTTPSGSADSSSRRLRVAS